jgi:hypothetical protein
MSIDPRSTITSASRHSASSYACTVRGGIVTARRRSQDGRLPLINRDSTSSSDSATTRTASHSHVDGW